MKAGILRIMPRSTAVTYIHIVARDADMQRTRLALAFVRLIGCDRRLYQNVIFKPHVFNKTWLEGNAAAACLLGRLEARLF